MIPVYTRNRTKHIITKCRFIIVKAVWCVLLPLGFKWLIKASTSSSTSGKLFNINNVRRFSTNIDCSDWFRLSTWHPYLHAPRGVALLRLRHVELSLRRLPFMCISTDAKTIKACGMLKHEHLMMFNQLCSPRLVMCGLVIPVLWKYIFLLASWHSTCLCVLAHSNVCFSCSC